jgi:hypothetical protein
MKTTPNLMTSHFTGARGFLGRARLRPSRYHKGLGRSRALPRHTMTQVE